MISHQDVNAMIGSKIYGGILRQTTMKYFSDGRCRSSCPLSLHTWIRRLPPTIDSGRNDAEARQLLDQVEEGVGL
jgi:hypothetical protein